MAKDILLYGRISEYNTLYFFDQIKEAREDEPEVELELRINVEGGSPEYGMEVIRKVQENSDSFIVKVGAACHSMGFFILCYVPKEKIEVTEVTQALLHRAAYPDWMEGDSSFKGSIYEESLVKTNKDLEKALRARVNVEALEMLPQMKEKNLTVKDIFSMEGRAEVMLTGRDLKNIGIANSIYKITPKKEAEMKSVSAKFNNCKSLEEFKMAASIAPEKVEPKNKKVMTLAEIKAENPALYQEIFNLGVASEKDRVEACLVFIDIDPKAVKEAIEGGKPLSQKQMAEFTFKSSSAASLEALKAKGKETEVVTDPVVDKTDKEKQEAAFLGDVLKKAGVKGEATKEVVMVSKTLN